MICCDVLLDFAESFEAFEKTILEHSVEFMFNASEHGILLINVKTELIEGGVPVELV